MKKTRMQEDRDATLADGGPDNGGILPDPRMSFGRRLPGIDNVLEVDAERGHVYLTIGNACVTFTPETARAVAGAIFAAASHQDGRIDPVPPRIKQVIRSVVMALQVPRSRFGKLDSSLLAGDRRDHDLNVLAHELALPHGGADIVDKSAMVLQAAIGDTPESIVEMYR